MAKKNRNMLVIVVDSLRKDRLSVYNDDVSFTSNIEEIAEKAEVYTNVNSQAPWTLPSHASVFTGKYPWEHSATQRKPKLETNRKLLAERFKEKGYKTILITPNVWLSRPRGTARGFDEVENFLGIMDNPLLESMREKINDFILDLSEKNRKRIASINYKLFDRFFDKTKNRKTVNKTKEFIGEIKDENFFTFVNLMSAHEPYEKGDPPDEYMEKRNLEDFSGVPKTEREFLKNHNTDLQKTRETYDAAVDYTDDLIGEINQCLKENNLKEDTILVLMSDHGQALGDDGVFSHAFTLTESVTEAVLIADDPSLNETEENSDLLELRDLYNLLPNLAGISNETLSDRDLVKGGYEYPELMSGTIPEDRKDEFYRKLLYIKDESRKIIKSVKEDDESSYGMIDAKTQEEVEIDKDMKKHVDNIRKVEETGEVETDEKIKKRLEELGYK